MRLRQVLSTRIHRAAVTEADINYVGSITIDEDLLERVGMIPGELVHVWNVTNGAQPGTASATTAPAKARCSNC